MPINCSSYEQAYNDACDANEAAELSLASAEAALDSAEWGYGAALAAELACGVTVETVVGFVLCEAAAVAWAESAERAIESAEFAIAAAEITIESTEGTMEKTLEDWCSCLGGNN